MAGQLDLTLPATAPPVGRFHDEPMEMRPAALYSLVDLSHTELMELQRVCESKSEVENTGSNIRLAPRCSFAGEPLRAIFDYHLELNNSQPLIFDPVLFVVAITKDWGNKVLLVTLDDDDLECKTDSFPIRSQDVGLIIINLQLSNSGWSEEKECYSIKPHNIGESRGSDGDDDDYNNDSDGDNDTNNKDNHGKNTKEKNSNKPSPTPPDDPGSPTHGPIPPNGPNPTGYYIGVYAISGLNYSDLINTLEPFSWMKKPQEFGCRLQAILPASSPDLISDAMAIHPSRCASNPWLHKFLFLIADTDMGSLSKQGIVLASLGGTAKRKIFPAGATQRVPFSALSAVQNHLCGMALGVRSWLPSDGPAVGVVRCNNNCQAIEVLAPILDSRWERREDGEDLVVFTPLLKRVEGEGFVKVKYSLADAVRNWPSICEEERFRSNFARNYFIYVDSPDAESNGVLLVKVDRTGEEEKTSLNEKVEIWRVGAKTAYRTLKDVISGRLAWEGKISE